MQNNRLHELDAIRGLAALSVVLYHYTYRYYEIYPNENKLPFSFEYGHYGVQAFFIVSGFVIFMTLQKTTRTFDFISHRFIRLFPTYWISVFITFAAVSIFSLPGRETTVLEFFANLSMVHTQFGINGVDGVYWTLLYELKFYFLMLLLFIFKFLNKIETIGVILLSGIVIAYFFGIEHSVYYKISNQLFILDYISYFISGIMFYKIYANEAGWLTYMTLVLAFGIALFINRLDASFIIVLIYFLFVLLSSHKLKVFVVKPLVFSGTISYALYLIHQNIGYIILNYIQEFNISMWVGTFFAICISLVIATIITFLFEKRVIFYLKNSYNKYKLKNV